MFKKIWQNITAKKPIQADSKTKQLAKTNLDSNSLELLEEQLLLANVSYSATQKIIEIAKNTDESNFANAIEKHLLQLLAPLQIELDWHKPSLQTALIIGINGSGKTTSIAKLANLLQQQKYKIMLAAGDTFRAAAIDQLKYWGNELGVSVVAQQQGSDTAAVIFDAMQSAMAKKYDILLADTAGRLHNNDDLMNELNRTIRVIKKFDEQAPQHVFLVCDATAGSNVIEQVAKFQELAPITALLYTKADIAQKCGTLISVANEFSIPIAYLGTGEKITDLQVFNAKEFVDKLMQQ